MSSTLSGKGPSTGEPSSTLPDTALIFPLTFQQRRLWFLDQLEPGSSTYNITFSLRMRGQLNREALEASINEIVRRHEVFRTSFPTQNGGPVQLIHPELRVELPLLDLSHYSGQEREQEAQRIVRTEAKRPLDLLRGPLLSGSVLQLGDQDHVLVLSTHHIVFDGWSRTVLVRELAALYENFSIGKASPLADLRLQYADFAVWQSQELQGETLNRQLSYWKHQLTGAPGSLDLPTDHPRPAMQTYNGANLILPLSKKLTQALHKLSRDESVTLFMTLLATFQVLLFRYSGQEDIVVGIPIANRTRPELEELIGFFANTLALRADLSGNPTFRELLSKVKEVALGAYANQDMPFEKLVEELRPERSLSHNPIFQVLFSLQNAAGRTFQLKGLELSQLDSHSGMAKFDLSLFMQEGPEGLVGRAEFNTDLFDSLTIARMLGHFRVLLEAIVENPGIRLRQLPLLTTAERYQLVTEWNRTERAFPADRCLHQLFEAQAESRPDRVAVTFGKQQLTYRELNERANQVAHLLIQQGVGPGSLVGIYVERSPEMMIGLLGIQKSGAAYVPLDPAYPKERLRLTVEDSKIRVLLSEQALLAGMPQHSATVFCLDDWSNFEDESKSNPGVRSRPEDLVYVIFTSGSTGRPKGVQVPHRAVVNLLTFMQQELGIGDHDVIPALASFAFDMCIPELYLPLIAGGKLVIVSREIAVNGEELRALLEQANATLVHATPTTWRLLLDAGYGAGGRTRVIGAEPLPHELFVRLMQTGEPLYNFYGPTETTVWSTFHRFTSADEPITVGRPLANTQVYVLDRDLQLVPIGVPGEIHIGGTGVTHGYLSRPDLTSEKFIPDPFSKEAAAKMYKTGDLGRYLPDGRIEFLGRADNQVKVRGFRIELGDIEAALSAHPSVKESVVIAREDRPGDKRLVAYVTARDGQVNPNELRRHLKERLPEYMVPASFVTLEKFPLNANGKVDRRALPAPEARDRVAETDVVQPRTPIEGVLAEIWAEVLGLDQLGIHDNFFDLGGHSLLATQVVSRIRRTLQLEIPLRMLFESPTVAGLSERVEAAQKATEGLDAPPLVPISRDGKVPLSFGQQRLWFLDRLESRSAVYNIPLNLQLQGQLDIPTLELALSEIVRRHEALRTNVGRLDDEPVQIVRPAEPFSLPVTDLSRLPQGERQSQALRVANEEADRGFDLQREPLLRGSLLRLSEENHILLLTVHHMVFDGWSANLFLDELIVLYQSFVAAKASPLPELGLQYADFAAWQRSYLQGEALEKQLEYWKQQLAGAPPSLDLPADHARPRLESFQGARHAKLVPRAVVDGIKALSRGEGVTLFMSLLAAFNVLLSRYSGQSDVVVGTPVASRNRAETEKLIGFFVNTLVLRSDTSGNPTFRELLARVRETTLGAYAHQEVPFERLVEELRPERDLSRHPIFQVMFILQNTPKEKRQIPGLTMSPFRATKTNAKFDLLVSISETAEGLRTSFEYNTDLFEAATVERFSQRFQCLLEEFASNPDLRIAEVPLLSDNERHQLLQELNATQVEYPNDVCVHQMFEAQVARTPDAVAVSFGTQQISYRQLNSRANQLARYLQSLGVAPEALVGVCLERSIDMIVAVLAVLKAGGAYIPIDPAYPKDRTAFVLEDTNAPVLLTQESLVGSLPFASAKTIKLDTEWAQIEAFPSANVDSPVDSRNLAYVIYTSGSTGKPKGVQIEHRSLVNFLCSMRHEPGITASDRVLAETTLSFDIAGLELYLPLITGAQIVLANREEAQDAQKLIQKVAQTGITLMQATPATWRLMLEAGWQGNRRLKILCGGEALPRDLADQLLERCAELWNVYGPTETTVWSTLYRVQAEDAGPVSLGRPIANTEIFVLDSHRQPVPIGVMGELYIGGDGLARGYLNRPELTAEKFVPHPFSSDPQRRLYRTGDLVRYQRDGNLVYLGRADNQVKLRGFRIELGEIENTLANHPAVQQAVVVVREDTPGDKRLVAYIVAGEQQLANEELREHLKQSLPDYMVPGIFVALPAFPLTPNGKVDRRALPAPDYSRAPSIGIGPRNRNEEILQQIWQRVLGLASVGVKDNFFEIGGHSLLAVRLLTEIKNVTGKEIPLAALFQGATIECLATQLDNDVSNVSHELVLEIQGEGSQPPLFGIVVPGANALGYIQLSRYLGDDQPLYKIQGPGPRLRERPYTAAEFERLAEEYVEALQKVQPHGPYYFLGMCEGARIAFDMARHLEATGEKVQLLGILDTWVVENTQRRVLWRLYYYRQRWRRLKRLTFAERMQTIASSLINTIQRVLHVGKPRRSLWPATYWPGKNFVAPKVQADITIFKNRKQPLFYVNDPCMGWAARTAGKVKTYAIVARHLQMLREPYVQDVAQKLSQCLKSLRAANDAEVKKSYAAAAFEAPLASKAGASQMGKLKNPPVLPGHERRKMQIPPVRKQSSWSTVGSPAALTVQQQRLWLLEQLGNETALNVPMVVHLTGKLDQSYLRDAIAALLNRHPILSWRIEAKGQEPVWKTASTDSSLRLIDARHIRKADRDQHVHRIAVQATQEKFALDRGPLLRSLLLEHGPDDHTLILIAHAIVCDSLSATILLRDLAALYESLQQDESPHLPDLGFSYGDSSAAQKLYLESNTFKQDLSYWKQSLQGVNAGLELPVDHARPHRPSFRGGQESFVLSAQIANQLEDLARRNRTTMSSILLSAFVSLLYRYSGSSDIVLGVETTGRTSATEDAVGQFANTLPFRLDLSANTTFRELVERVTSSERERSERQNLPLGSLIQALHLGRDLSRNPLFQIVFAYRDLPKEAPAFSEVQASLVPLGQNPEMFDLTFSVSPAGNDLVAVFSYSAELFDRSTIQRMIGHFRVLLDAMHATPEREVSNLPLLTDAERRQLIMGSNVIEQAIPAVCVHDLFQEAVKQAGDSVAVTIGDLESTYSELNRRSNQLAHYLQKLGAGPDKLVGIYLERSIEMIVALLGVLKAGAAYVPLDPAYPKDRVAFIVADAGLELLLTQDRLVHDLPAHSAKITRVDGDWHLIADESDKDPVVAVKPENLAYVLYTSGSTGQPKGVQIEHRSVVNFLASMQHEPGITDKDVLLAVTTLSFDIAGLEIFLPLLTGARIVLATREQASDGGQLRRLLEKMDVTLMQATPATWRLLLDAGWTGKQNLKILCGGEALPRELAQQLLPCCRELWNMYGPTETTIWSAIYRVQDVNWATAPIGHPISNTRMYVLDSRFQLLPIGVAGELYIGGEGLARGYWKRPERTAEKFISDPFHPESGARLYRTGDLARSLPDGNFQYLGRLDTQIKLRGFRIELGEIESVLSQHPAVQQAVVSVREDARGEKILVGYFVAKRGIKPEPSDLRAFAREKLPEFMVPSRFVQLDSLPLTPNGKIDRKALPEPKAEITDGTHAVAPRDDLEATLVGIFQSVLGIQGVGIHEDFFELGGHSLMAARMIADIRQLTQKDISLSVLFQGANVESLARILRNGVPCAPHETVLRIQQGDSQVPFFAVVSPGESALGYALLARHMGPEQTLYRLQGAGPIISSSERPYTPTEMDELANEYIAAMRTVQPFGPYYLGGMCDGAHIALRMAQALEKRGEQVAMLAILDTWVLENSQRFLLWHIHYFSERFRDFRKLPTRKQLQTSLRTLGNFAARALGRPRSAWSKAYWPNEEFVPPTFNGRATLFKRPKQPYYYIQDPEMGWGARAMGGVDIEVVPIDHTEMLREPHVRLLGNRLAQCLKKASSSNSLPPLEPALVLQSTGGRSQDENL